MQLLNNPQLCNSTDKTTQLCSKSHCKQCTVRWKHCFAMQLLKNAQLCNRTDKTTQLYAESTPSVSEYVFFLLWGYWLSSLARIIWSWHSNSLSCLNDCLLRVDTAQGLILKKPMLFAVVLLYVVHPPFSRQLAQAGYTERRKREWTRMVDIVPRRLFFTALQWIAIAQGPKIQQKNKL